MKRAETEQRNSLPGTARDKRGPDAEGKCVKDTEEETINSSDGVDHDLGTQNKLGRCCHTMRFFNINGAEMPPTAGNGGLNSADYLMGRMRSCRQAKRQGHQNDVLEELQRFECTEARKRQGLPQHCGYSVLSCSHEVTFYSGGLKRSLTD